MSEQCFRNSLFLVALLFLLGATSDDAPLDKKKPEPLVITSHRMDAERLGEKVTFTGNATLKKEGVTLSSDLMIVFYDIATKEIREVKAQGNVVVRKEGGVALSDNALYTRGEETIVLTGNARIIENENQFGGEKITLYIDDDRSIIEGGGKVMIYQDKVLTNKKRK